MATASEHNPGPGGNVALLSSRHYTPALDGIRGLAVMGVMVRHFVEDMHPTLGIDRVFFHVSRLGSSGVDLFFALSGFLITGILLDSRSGPRYFINFYSRRTLRIFPLYYLTLAVTFWIWPLVVHDDHLLLVNQAPQFKAYYFSYAANWLFGLTGTYKGLTCVWSLCIEEQFYILWPLVVYFLTPRRLLWVGGALLLLSIGLRWWWFASLGNALAAVQLPPDAGPKAISDFLIIGPYTLTPMRLDGLVLGAMLAAAGRVPGLLPALKRVAPWTLTLGVALLVAMVVREFGKGRTQSQLLHGPQLLAMCSGSLILLCLRPGTFWHWAFNLAILRSFGKYCYALYLFHPFVLVIMDQFVKQDDLPRVAGSLLPSMIAYALVGMAVSYGAAG